MEGANKVLEETDNKQLHMTYNKVQQIVLLYRVLRLLARNIKN
jgi:hypothetical protein